MNSTINTLIIKTKNNNKYYTWTGALNKTGFNLHTPKMVSGSSMMIKLISSVHHESLLMNGSVFSLPHIPPNPMKLIKISNSIHIHTTITKTPNLTISIYPTCLWTHSSKDKLSTKNSTFRNPPSSHKSTTTTLHLDMAIMVTI